MAGEEVRWRAPEPHRLIREPLDLLTALYDRASGQTHLLAEPMPQILDALVEGEASVAELLGRLSQRFDLPTEDGVAAVIAERLAELAALGLVEAR